MSDVAKFRTQLFTLLSIGSRVVTFGKKLLPFAGKFEIGYFCYDANGRRCWSLCCAIPNKGVLQKKKGYYLSRYHL